MRTLLNIWICMNRDGNAEHNALLYLHERWVRENKVCLLIQLLLTPSTEYFIIWRVIMQILRYFSKKNFLLILKSSWTKKLTDIFLKWWFVFISFFFVIQVKKYLSEGFKMIWTASFKYGMVQLVICMFFKVWASAQFEPVLYCNIKDLMLTVNL